MDVSWTIDCCQTRKIKLIRIIVIQIDVVWVIQVGVDVIRINVIQNYRIFAPKFSTSKLFSGLEFSEILLPPGFPIPLFTAKFHDVLLSYKFDIIMLKNPKLPMFIGWIPSPLLRPNLITVPLFRLEIYGLMLLMVLNDFYQIISFMFFPKSILISLQLFWLWPSFYQAYQPLPWKLPVRVRPTYSTMPHRILPGDGIKMKRGVEEGVGEKAG